MVKSFIDIKAKSSGTTLYEHSKAVEDVILYLNEKYQLNLNEDVLRWSAIMHDLGKAHPQFQKNMETNNFDITCRHEIASIFFILCVPEEIREQVALIILSHHKSLEGEQRSCQTLYDTDGWASHYQNISNWGKEVVQHLKYYYNIDANVPTVEECKAIVKKYHDVIINLTAGFSIERGLFQMADHFASAYEGSEERSQRLDELCVIPNIDYYKGKDEKYPLSLISSDTTKRHTIVIAPTGCGKTNFMMKRCTKRIFYTLPFQASINAMYLRFKKELGDYRMGIKHSGMKSVDFMGEDDKKLSNLFGLPLKVMTPFQIFCLLLALKGHEKTTIDVQNQDIIFDEIHTYQDPRVFAYLFKLIEKLVTVLGCNIHICTATIPTALLEKLIQILGVENTQIVRLDDMSLQSFNRHKIHMVNESFESQYDKIIERYNNGEKVLIVHNQVGKAQETYLHLKQKVPAIMLIHSRFTRAHRRELEKKLIEDFNKKPEPCIVVSTQVVEVSIDINFDVLYTDCADIMSLIQRFGRVNRQRRNIGVIKPIYVVANKGEYDNLPYSKIACQRTFTALEKYNGKILPETDIQKVIDEVHPTIIEWKLSTPIKDFQKQFCDAVNNSVAKELNFNGYIGIQECNIEQYRETQDSKLEIPLPVHRVENKLYGLFKDGTYKPIPSTSDEPLLFAIVPNGNYSDELGFFHKSFN